MIGHLIKTWSLILSKLCHWCNYASGAQLSSCLVPWQASSAAALVDLHWSAPLILMAQFWMDPGRWIETGKRRKDIWRTAAISNNLLPILNTPSSLHQSPLHSASPCQFIKTRVPMKATVTWPLWLVVCGLWCSMDDQDVLCGASHFAMAVNHAVLPGHVMATQWHHRVGL